MSDFIFIFFKYWIGFQVYSDILENFLKMLIKTLLHRVEFNIISILISYELLCVPLYIYVLYIIYTTLLIIYIYFDNYFVLGVITLYLGHFNF